jgi:hypothetical protein
MTRPSCFRTFSRSDEVVLGHPHHQWRLSTPSRYRPHYADHIARERGGHRFRRIVSLALLMAAQVSLLLSSWWWWRLPDTNIVQKQSQVLLMFVVSRNDSYILGRIETLRQAFGKNLLVVWDNPDANCPTPMIEIASCIDKSHQPVSLTHQLSHEGKGHERAVMWAMEHRHQFEHVWIVEQDVEYTNVDLLVQTVGETSDLSADLLHQEPFSNPHGNEMKEEWYWLDEVLNHQ